MLKSAVLVQSCRVGLVCFVSLIKQQANILQTNDVFELIHFGERSIYFQTSFGDCAILNTICEILFPFCNGKYHL